MKDMKKLFLSVFALSALILSACSGSQKPSGSSKSGGGSSGGQQDSSQNAGDQSQEGDNSSEQGGSSSEEGGSSSEQGGSSQEGGGGGGEETQADYRVKFGTKVYGLTYDDSREDVNQYYFGSGVKQDIVKNDVIVFEKLVSNNYTTLTATPDEDDYSGWKYNNVSVSSTNYVVKETGNVEVYLKQDKTTEKWTFWINGGGDIEKPEPGYYLCGDNIGSHWRADSGYKLTQETDPLQPNTYFINYNAVQGDVFKICEVLADGSQVWYPHKDANEQLVGRYKSSSEEQSAIYKGYLYGAEDYNMETIVPGEYRIDIDSTNHAIWTSINLDSEHENAEKRTPLKFGVLTEQGQYDLEHEEASQLKSLNADGYKYSVTVPLSYISDQEIYVRWDDNSPLKIEYDDEDNPSLKQYFNVDEDNFVLTKKGTHTETVELSFVLQCKKMIVSAEVVNMVTVRLQATTGLQLYTVGDFNNWTPSAEYLLHENGSSGYYSGTFGVANGEYGFKFYNDTAKEYEYDGTNRTLNVAGDTTTQILIYGDKDSHIPEYYYVKVQGTGTATSSLTPNSGNTEYSVTQVTLAADDELKFNLDGDWRGYTDLKLSEFAQTNFGPADNDNNIKVKNAGTYDIYVKVTPDAEGDYAGKSIWIEQYVAPLYFIKSSADWTDTNRTLTLVDSENSIYKIDNVTFAANEEFGIAYNKNTNWYHNLNTWENCGFTISGSNLKVTEAGTYTVYLYLNNPSNPVGLDKDEDTTIVPRGNLDIHFVGDNNDWTHAASNGLVVADNYTGILSVVLDANDEFKICTSAYTGGYTWANIGTAFGSDDTMEKFEEGTSNSNIKCLVAGTYDFFINGSGNLWIEYIG